MANRKFKMRLMTLFGVQQDKLKKEANYITLL
nr:MAG TPA: hypothetical protein [Caudoviricetes sp.]